MYIYKNKRYPSEYMTYNRYTPSIDNEKQIWSGRIDAYPNEYIYQKIKYINLNDTKNQNYKNGGYAILGFKCDEGIRRNLGKTGAFDGPVAFRKSFGGLPVHGDFNLYDAGDVLCIDGNLEQAQKELGICVDKILDLNLMPIIIGGGHETAWGHYQGLHNHFGKSDVAILNFDAHFDLRPLVEDKYGSSGTPFYQIEKLLKQNGQDFYYYCAGIQPFSNTKSLFDHAKNSNVKYILAESINSNPLNMDFINTVINGHDKIYVTICLDVFNANIAPGVSAPQPLGINPEYIISALRLLKKSKKVASLDIVELSPKYDINNQTAKLAGLLLMEYLV